METTDISDSELSKVLADLTPSQRAIISRSIKIARQQTLRQESFSGPIPHPDILMGYDNVKAGLADRIVRMAEKEQDHRFECDRDLIKGPLRSTSRGQWMGFVIAVLFLCGAVFLGVNGQPWLAGIIGGGTLIALVTVFVTNKQHDAPGKMEPEDTPA